MPYYKRIEADPALARSYITILETIAALARAGDPRVIYWRRIFEQLTTDYERIGQRAPLVATSRVRRRIRATAVRPTTSGTLENAIVSHPLPTSLPAASFGIADLEVLNQATMRPGANRPYWRAQEYGYEGNVGRVVPGYFEDAFGNQYAPNRDQFREHPYFRAQPYTKGTPAMVIGRAIEARHFLRDGTSETIRWLNHQTSRAQERALTAAARIPRATRP